MAKYPALPLFTSDIFDEIFTYIRTTEHNHGKCPDIFLCSRDTMDRIKAAAVSSPPVTIHHDNPYGIYVMVFNIPVMIAPGIANIQPFINSAEPKRLCAKTYKDDVIRYGEELCQ